MRTANYTLFVNTPMSGNAESEAIILPNIFGYSIQAVFTGSSINGSIKIQVSDDPAPQFNPSNEVPTNWTDIPCSMVTLVEAGDITWNVMDVMYAWYRLVYVDGSSGASNGILSARAQEKGM